MFLRIRRARTALTLSAALVAVSCGDSLTDPPPATGDPVTIETSTLAEAVQGVGYTQQLTAAGGTGPYSWVLAAGSLPAGLTLSPSGAISGMPAAPGSSSFRVRVTDANGRTATADLAIPVVQVLAIHTLAIPLGMVGEAYAGQLQAVGGRGALTWSIAGGPAASWMAISATGALSGDPPVPGASAVIVAVADESGQQATREFPIVIFHPLAVADISLPVAVQGRVYAFQLLAAGGDGIYIWDIEAGALPAGLELSGAGVLTGVPDAGGEFTFVVRVTDGRSRSATRAVTITVDRAPTIQTASVPPGRPGDPYTFQLAATGGTGSYTWALIDGALPAGITLSGAGVLSGTPGALGSSNFVVQVTDQAGAAHTRPFTLVVAEVAGLTAGTPVTGLAGAAGSEQFFVVAVPEGAARVIFTLSGGTGDADLYVRHGSLPAQYMYDCRPFRPGSDEICTFVAPAAGPWYVMVRGYADYAGVSLVATIEH